MSIVKSKLDAYELPEQTTYRVNRPKRTNYQQTHGGGQYNSKNALIVKDFTIDVRIPDTTRTVFDNLDSRYDSANDYTFIGHLKPADDTWLVHIDNLDQSVEAGLYQIRMTLRVVGDAP